MNPSDQQADQDPPLTLTLAFVDSALEREYQHNQREQVLRFVRPALVLMIPVIGMFGLLDPILIPDHEAKLWLIRLYIALSIVAVIALTYTSFAYQYIQVGMLGLTLLLGASNIALVVSLPDESGIYFVGLILLMMYAHFSGLRFTLACASNTLTLLAYAFVEVSVRADPGTTLLMQLPFLVAGYLVATFAGYTTERQRRNLFFQTQAVDSERRRNELKALHDPLTGLPNRQMFESRVGQCLARARRQQSAFAVLFIDLDNFKTINDNYGHLVGDEVLQAVAARLTDQVRTEDTAARFGGDEFVVLSEDVPDKDGVRVAAERILARIAEPILVEVRQTDTIQIRVTASLGISLWPEDGDTLAELVKRADDAMYNVKSSGKAALRFFSPDSARANVTDNLISLPPGRPGP